MRIERGKSTISMRTFQIAEIPPWKTVLQKDDDPVFAGRPADRGGGFTQAPAYDLTPPRTYGFEVHYKF